MVVAGDHEPPSLVVSTSRDLERALTACDFPLVVWTSTDGIIRLANHLAAELLGLSLQSLTGRQIYEFLLPADAVRAGVHAVSSGAIDSLRAKRRIARPGGLETPVWVWTRVVDFDGNRGGVTLVVPYADAGRLGRDKSEPWRDLFPVAVGTADSKWRILSISSEIQELLGRSSPDCTGLALMGLVHPEDLPKLRPHHWQEDGTPMSRCRVRFAHADDYWVEVCLLATRRLADLGFVFALVGAPAAPLPSPLDRTAELELRLRHIAAEVRAARVLDDFSALPAPSDFPPLRELTTRQWEILSRLLQGQRVPTIANELFLTPSTVRNHLASIFRRFGVHSQPELLALLQAKGHRTEAARGSRR